MPDVQQVAAPTDIVVRAARGHDVADLQRLQVQAWDGLASVRGGEQLRAEDPGRIFGQPGVSLDGVFVATLDDAVVGWGAAHCERLIDGAVVGRVEAVFVEPQARQLGGGEQLLDALLTWVRGAGAGRVTANALPGDRLTKNLFERAGMPAIRLVVGRRLEEPAADDGRGDEAIDRVRREG